ncbi:hypothetical protein AB0D10_38295 [Kitasatospora sp. NPDC048545]|uniref:hypothetical protein n=1 Tax=Kitasatospora sp. NPDC048545 TaxID=3157208 RepID=UPI0033D8EB4D
MEIFQGHLKSGYNYCGDTVAPDLTVISLGSGISPARLFARRGGVSLRSVESIEEIAEKLFLAPGPVLLSLTDEITFSELSGILSAAHEAAKPCGFIDSWRGLPAALRHAAGIIAWQPTRTPGITFWNSDGTTTGRAGAYANIDILAHDEKRPESALGSARRTMSMITHGNGADAPFGDGLLCGRLLFEPRMTLTNYLPCGQDGPCVRGRQVGSETLMPHRSSTRDIGGDIVIWGTCYGALTSDSIFDPRGGLLAGLLDRPGAIPQVITAVRATEVNELEVLAACARVEAGETLGSVVAGLNKAYLASAPKGTLPPWILFGDPTAKVAENPSVQVVGSGTEISEGLSLYRGSPRSAEASLLLLKAGTDEVPVDLWVRPLAEQTEGLVLRRDAGPAVPINEADHEPQTLSIFRREVSAIQQLIFSDMFFQLAQIHPASAGFRYQSALSERAQNTIEHLTSLQLSPHPFLPLSGAQEDLQARLAAERDNWRRLNDGLFESLSYVLKHIGGVIHHHYAFVPLAPQESSVRPCPFCHSPADLAVYHLPRRLSSRAVLRCGRCTVVSDADEQYGTVLLDGPEEIKPGEPAQFTLRPSRTPVGGIQYARAALFAQPTPWQLLDQGTDEALEDIDSEVKFDLTWTPSVDTRPGRYFLLAPMVVDGSVMVARRSVVIA